jgi:ubiquinone/menaquinone biosynthesis C-methylase UbiE
VDYRQSHLSKGGTYDEAIDGSPFDAYMARWEAEYLREIVPLLTQGRGRYVDFACGTGRITATVSPLVAESVGIDISESMLAIAQQKCPSTRFVCADLARQTADLGLGLFDLATSFRFFGNAEDDLRVAALGAISRVLRRGGHLIINSHRNPHAIGSLLQALGAGPHGMDLNYWKISRMLRDQGFRIVSARPIGFWVYRSRLRNERTLTSAGATIAERAFRHRIWAPFAPDCILLAEKR